MREPATKSQALNPPVCCEECSDREEQFGNGYAMRTDQSHHSGQLWAKKSSSSEPRSRPHRTASDVPREEDSSVNLSGTQKRRCDKSKAGDEFRHEQQWRSVTLEPGVGLPDT